MFSSNKTLNILLLGDSGVGKTTIVNTIVGTEHYFMKDEYVPTIGVDFRTRYPNDTSIMGTEFYWDTAGSHHYFSVTKEYYKDKKIVIFVYDKTNINSLYNIEHWIKHFIDVNKTKHIHFILLENKADKDETPENIETRILLAKSYIEKYSMSYFSISCKHRHTLDKVITHIEKLYNYPNLLSNRDEIKENTNIPSLNNQNDIDTESSSLTCLDSLFMYMSLAFSCCCGCRR